MDLLLMDRLLCPRCGPPFGLILLADRVADRRVLEGHLGCPNCREHFPVVGGVGDLRHPLQGGGLAAPKDASTSQGDSDPADDAEEVEGAFRLAALLGVTRGPGRFLLVGSSARWAARLAQTVPEIEVVAAGGGSEALPEQPGVSRIRLPDRGTRLPFQPRTFRGVALEGSALVPLLPEIPGVLVHGERLVVFDPEPQGAERVQGAGMELLLLTERVLVAALTR
jgi:uncharacterized protein YbaR (Trm112 family)